MVVQDDFGVAELLVGCHKVGQFTGTSYGCKGVAQLDLHLLGRPPVYISILVALVLSPLEVGAVEKPPAGLENSEA